MPLLEQNEMLAGQKEIIDDEYLYKVLMRAKKRMKRSNESVAKVGKRMGIVIHYDLYAMIEDRAEKLNKAVSVYVRDLIRADLESAGYKVSDLSQYREKTPDKDPLLRYKRAQKGHLNTPKVDNPNSI